MKIGALRICCGTALALLAVGNVRADAMYWMVDQKDADDPIAFQFVRMASDTASGTYYYGNGAGGDWFLTSDGLNSDRNPAVWSSGDVSATSFYFELYDASATLLAKSVVFDFETVRAGGYIYSFDDPEVVPKDNPLKVTSFNVVPEPTGGMLALLGMAVLALRRRRNVFNESKELKQLNRNTKRT